MNQRDHFYTAQRKLADGNRVFLDLLPSLIRKELETLIAKRPALWGRFSGYLDKLP